MIIDAILLLFQGILEVLLLPLNAINITIDFLSGITVFTSFLQVIAYILPWENILPLIILTIGLILFRTVVALIKLVIEFIPFM